MKPCANKPDRETLRHQYEDEKLSTRQIGTRYGVAHITIRRWLTQYGIDVRPTGRGLENRGVPAPTFEELFDMVHVQHLSYRDIGARYGVDFTAVPHWLEQAGVPAPTVWETRRKGHVPKLPSDDELRHRRGLGESAESIARSYGVPGGAIVEACRRAGIPVNRSGWQRGKRYGCSDGHEVMSVYEQRVDNWLYEHELPHLVGKRYPFHRAYSYDFRVRDTYIEVWGVRDNAAYTERKKRKIELCEEHGIDLISISYWQFGQGRCWWRPLERLLESPPDQLF